MVKIRVVLAEDHETVRHGLRLLINSQEDMEVVGEAADGAAAIACAEKLLPRVLVLDVSMPVMNGLQATRALAQHADIAVLALTRYNDDAYVKEMLGAGAAGYVLKQSATGELLRAIRAVARGTRYLDPRLGRPVTGEYLNRASPKSKSRPTISERESDVLKRMAQGYSNKEIAGAMEISVKTVEVHKANAMRKLGLRGRTDVVRYALLQGWLTDT
jgi:DNA-binding NarL/FixJ family response regulator